MLTYLNKITYCIVHLLNKYIYYIHTYARVTFAKTPFIVPQKHNNSYARIQKRILSHSKPRILLKWISCKENR